MNGRYGIRLEYTTGDSFNSRREKSTLECRWSDLNVAKTALKRIEEHYKWQEAAEQYEKTVRYDKSGKLSPPVEPEWHVGLSRSSVKLPLDNGNEVQLGAFWIGYFEELHGARIVWVWDLDADGLSFWI